MALIVLKKKLSVCGCASPSKTYLKRQVYRSDCLWKNILKNSFLKKKNLKKVEVCCPESPWKIHGSDSSSKSSLKRKVYGSDPRKKLEMHVKVTNIP